MNCPHCGEGGYKHQTRTKTFQTLRGPQKTKIITYRCKGCEKFYSQPQDRLVLWRCLYSLDLMLTALRCKRHDNLTYMELAHAYKIPATTIWDWETTIYALPKERQMGIFQKFAEDKDARCHKCDGELIDHGVSGYAPGHGARRGFCTGCGMSTWYDIGKKEKEEGS
jgi:hypothetical protein